MTEINNENDSMEQYDSLHDFVDTDKPTDTMSFVYDSSEGEIDITIRFRDGQADALVDSDIDFLDARYSNVKILPDGDGNIVLALQDKIEIDGPLLSDDTEKKRVANIGLSISDESIDEFESRLDNHQNELENWTRKAEDRAEETELKFEVVNHEYLEGWRTKYNRSEIVLKPNKSIYLMTEDEKSEYEAMKRRFDTADNYPICPARFDVGDVLTVDEVDLQPYVEEVKQEKKTESKKEEIRNEHSELYGVDFDPCEFEEAKQEAIETGEKQEFASATTECTDSSEECNLDLVTYYVDKYGVVETERSHTW